MTTTGAATGAARRGRRVVVGAAGTGILLALAHAANDALTTVVPIFLPGLQVRFGFSETELAALVALLWVTTSMTQPFLGTLADRLGARTMAAGGLALGAVLLACWAWCRRCRWSWR